MTSLCSAQNVGKLSCRRTDYCRRDLASCPATFKSHRLRNISLEQCSYDRSCIAHSSTFLQCLRAASHDPDSPVCCCQTSSEQSEVRARCYWLWNTGTRSGHDRQPFSTSIATEKNAIWCQKTWPVRGHGRHWGRGAATKRSYYVDRDKVSLILMGVEHNILFYRVNISLYLRAGVC
jgi:hypothetical protein